MWGWRGNGMDLVDVCETNGVGYDLALLANASRGIFRSIDDQFYNFCILVICGILAFVTF
jgi:hypothetical protein